MNQEVKQEWISRLVSGNYQQETGILHSGGNRFCALGVLCDVYAETWGYHWVPRPGYEDEADLVVQEAYVVYGDDATLVMPRAIKDWSDLGAEWWDVYKLNDMDHKSFAEIAEWIEANL